MMRVKLSFAAKRILKFPSAACLASPFTSLYTPPALQWGPVPFPDDTSELGGFLSSLMILPCFQQHPGTPPPALAMLTNSSFQLHCHHFLYEYCALVTQSCLTLCDSVNYSPPGSSVQGISQARILEWVAIPFSRAFPQPRDRSQVSCIAVRFFTI